MELNAYQQQASETAVYPDRGNNLIYTVLGLCGESGEMAEKMKKLIRDNEGVLTPERRQAMIEELSDVLWYVANTAFELGVNLEYVALTNLEKLASRKQRNVLHGEGDAR